MSWLFQIVFGCQPKSEFLHKTRAGKSQLVCANFDLLKDSRYRLTFSAQYLTSTGLEMGTVSTLINSLKGQGQTFQFPNLFPEKEQDTETRSFDDFRDKYMEKEKQKEEGDPRRGGVPDWFGL
uniref:Uncharacterized protein n=1 Tax=Zonotrichia albicollis TaxID=44394 RepID=A0A8D2NDY1_ZONAL